MHDSNIKLTQMYHVNHLLYFGGLLQLKKYDNLNKTLFIYRSDSCIQIRDICNQIRETRI